MGASRLFLAACLAGVLVVPVEGLCAPSGHPILSSDGPVHPGLKSGDNGTQRAYGDEPGDGSPAHGRHSDTPAGDSPAAVTPPPANTHSSLRNRMTARSAVLDTLGAVHDNGGMGGSDTQGLGLTVRPLTSTERQTLGLDGGLLVIGVSAGMGLKAGFQPGDVVLSLDGVGLTSTDQFFRLTQKLPHDRPVPVLVHRPNSNLFLPLGAPSRR